MKKLLLLLLTAGVAYLAACFLFPVFAGSDDTKILSRFTPEIRVFLLQDSPENRALLAKYRAAAAALDATGKQLENTAAGSEKDTLKQNYLRAGVAKLEVVKEIAIAYEGAVGQGADMGRHGFSRTDAAPPPEKPLLQTLWESPHQRAALLAAFAAAALVLLARFVVGTRASVPQSGSGVPPLVPASSVVAPGQPARSATPPLRTRPNPAALSSFRLALGSAAVPLEMLPVSAGSFEVGEGGRVHTVSVPFPFWLGEKEVTQAQWNAVMDKNPSKHLGDLLPVESVSHDEVADFCKKITAAETSARRLPAGYAYALPLEAEWEYAARAGGGATNSDGTAIANGGQTRPVGEGLPNPWGFYDMTGNVSEMCADKAVGNMVGNNGASLHYLGDNRHIIRGANFTQPKRGKEVRDAIIKNTVDEKVGFRLALRRVP
jgi:formylglycine-generating enzyme required for sulfatase activity